MVNTYGLTELEARLFLDRAKATLYWIQRDLPYCQHELTTAAAFIDELVAVDALHPITGYTVVDLDDEDSAREQAAHRADGNATYDMRHSR